MPEWALAFNKDPLEPVEVGSLEGTLLVHLESPELIENYRLTTNLTADFMVHSKQHAVGEVGHLSKKLTF
jgi:hypothetical protein